MAQEQGVDIADVAESGTRVEGDAAVMVGTAVKKQNKTDNWKLGDKSVKQQQIWILREKVIEVLLAILETMMLKCRDIGNCTLLD